LSSGLASRRSKSDPSTGLSSPIGIRVEVSTVKNSWHCWLMLPLRQFLCVSHLRQSYASVRLRQFVCVSHLRQSFASVPLRQFICVSSFASVDLRQLICVCS
jgi:hypothetical protein